MQSPLKTQYNSFPVVTETEDDMSPVVEQNSQPVAGLISQNLIFDKHFFMTLSNAELVKLCFVFATFTWVSFQWLRQCGRDRASDAKKLPPGPSGLPILGILLELTKPLHLVLLDLVEKFKSPIVCFKLGFQRMIVISDYKMIQTAFRSDNFTDRPKTGVDELIGGYGVVNSQRNIWHENRRFLQCLSFGAKNVAIKSERENNDCFIDEEMISPLEKKIKDEINIAMNILQTESESNGSEGVNVEMILSSVFSNVICSIVMSVRFDHNDKKFQNFMERFDEGFKLFYQIGALPFIPALKYLPSSRSACRKLMENHSKMREFVSDVIIEHEKTLDVNKPRDLIDSYLVENLSKDVEKSMGGDGLFKVNEKDCDAHRQIEQVVLDIFSAGVETTRTTLLWCIVYMINYPQVCEEVALEIQTLLSQKGRKELRYTDKYDLSYTHATLNEIMRMSSIVPLGTTHATKRDTHFGGYFIPKGTNIIPHIHAIHFNPQYFEEPKSFKPERFLSETTGKVKRIPEFIPFGVGRRMCLGRVIAEKEMFLTFATLVHKFEFISPLKATTSTIEMPSLEPSKETGVTLKPNSFRVIFKQRCHLQS